MASLSGIHLSNLRRLSAAGDLSGVSLKRVQLNYADRGLIPAAYSYYAELTGQKHTEVRDAMTENLSAAVSQGIGRELSDEAPLLGALASFLERPGTFSLSAAPAPPLSGAAFEAVRGDPAALRNALNLTVSVDGGEPVPLRFKEPAKAGG
jgi:hypothetical protein